MSLRVIWQHMDRSVTNNILYGPQTLFAIYGWKEIIAAFFFFYRFCISVMTFDIQLSREGNPLTTLSPTSYVIRRVFLC